MDKPAAVALLTGVSGLHRAIVVAAPPMLRVVTTELSKLKVVAVEVMSPSLTAISATDVMTA